MNPITAALGLGYATEEILNFLVSSSPKHGKAIQEALKQGYTPDQVADFVRREFEGKAYTKQAKRLERAIEGSASGSQRKAIAELRDKREQKLGRIIGGAGLAAAGAFAASRIPRATQAMGPSNLLGGPGAAAQGIPLPGSGPQGPAMGGGAAQAPGGQGVQGTMAQIMQAYQKHLARGGKLSLKSFMNTAAKTVMGNAMGAMAGGQAQDPGQPPMQAQQEPIDVTQEAQWSPVGGTEPPVQPGQPVPGAQAPMQPTPEEQPAPIIQVPKSSDPAEILQSLGIREKIDSLKGKGKSVELISLASNKFLSPEALEIVKQNNINVPAAVWEYMNEGVQPAETSETLAKQPTESVDSGSKLVEEQVEPKPLAAGSTVMLPNGVTGKVTGIEGNKVRITDDEGNKKIAPIEHALQPSPMAARFTQEEADDEIARYNASLTPLEKSAPLLYVSYNPSLQQMNVRWGTSPEQSGTYTNVSPETAKKVKDRITVNKTSGVTGEGVEWKEGEIGKYGSAVIQHVKSVLDESGALLHPYSVGEVIYNRHERADEAVARANTGKTRQEREEGRAKRAAKAAEKEEKELVKLKLEKERVKQERDKKHKQIQESREKTKAEAKKKAQEIVEKARKMALKKKK